MNSKLNDFNRTLFSIKILDETIQWIDNNLDPEDVFEEERLVKWMNDWMEENDVHLEENMEDEIEEQK